VIEQLSTWAAARAGIPERVTQLAWVNDQVATRYATGENLALTSVLRVHEPPGRRARIRLEFDPAAGFKQFTRADGAPGWSWYTGRQKMLEGTLDRRTGRPIMAPAQVAQLGMHEYVVLQAMVARYLELTS